MPHPNTAQIYFSKLDYDSRASDTPAHLVFCEKSPGGERFIIGRVWRRILNPKLNAHKGGVKWRFVPDDSRVAPAVGGYDRFSHLKRGMRNALRSHIKKTRGG